MSLINQSPYLDKYDPQKHYSQLLAVPGRVAQAREITEIQTTLKDIIKSVGDSIMDDGDILEGCQLSVVRIGDILAVRISAGRLYLQGMVFSVVDTDDESDPDYGKNIIPISGVGEELICVRVKETIITANEDPDLLDPAIGYENYKQLGCDRLKTELEFLNVDPNDLDTLKTCTIIGRLIDGVLVQEKKKKYSDIMNILARRTYDESGSYIVEGLETRVEPIDDAYFNVVVESGKAYVHGYEVVVPAANRIKLPRATTFVTIDTGKVNMYNEGSTTYLCQGPYAKEILDITGSVNITKTVEAAPTIDLQGYGTMDLIIIDPDHPEEQFTAGTDYNLAPGDKNAGITDKIIWISSYEGMLFLTYKRDYDFNPATDYEIIYDSNNDSRLSWKEGGSHPQEGTYFSIKFTKFLARRDTVYIDQDGVISVSQGTPADYGSEVAPEAPTFTLHLASVSSPPGGTVTTSTGDQSIRVANVGLTRFTMKDIHSIVSRVKVLMYDQSVLSLNTEAKDTDISNKKGIFTDNMLDLSKIDTYFNLTLSGELINENAPFYDTAIDLDSNMVYLPLINSVNDMTYLPDDSTVEKSRRLVSLNRTIPNEGRKIVLSQMKANKSFLVTPYIHYPQIPDIEISPSQDSWYDDTIIEVPKSVSKSKIVSSSSRRTSSGSGPRVSVSISHKDSVVGKEVEKVIDDDIISEEIITYCREREITVTGRHYPNNLDNIACYFDNQKLPMIPLGSTQAGTNEGTVKSDPEGNFAAKFTLPGGKFYTGTRVVNCESPIIRDEYLSSAQTYYKANGIARTIKRTITTITTLLKHRLTTTHYHYYNPDPLAQTFTLDTNTIITGVDVYFESKPVIPLGGASIPVICELRATSNGVPTADILGYKILDTNEVNISPDSSRATRFIFEDPVVLDAGVEYAIVLKSSSTDYCVFGAEINNMPDLLTGEPIVSNTYIQGVLETSSNNTSWTIHQKADLKFALISNDYVNQSVVNFDPIHSDEGFCRITLAAEFLEFSDTAITWEYSLDGGNSFAKLYPYSIETLSSLYHDIQLRATFKKTSSTTMSPLLDIESVSLVLSAYANDEHNYYVSNYISGLDPYDKLTIFLDVYTSNSLPIKVYMSPDKSLSSGDDYHLIEIPRDTDYEVSIGGQWREYKYEIDDLPTATGVTNLTNCRLFVDLHNISDEPIVAQTPAFRRLRAIMSNSVV